MSLRTKGGSAERYYDVLIAISVAFICYASFAFGARIPDSLPGADAVTMAFSTAFRLTARNLRDFSTNVLLYMPFGAFVALRASLDPMRRWSLLWLSAGTALSAFVETVQAFIDRYPSLLDVVSNTTGFLIAYSLFWYVTRRHGVRAESVIGLAPMDKAGNTIRASRLVYVVVFVLVQWLPLDLNVSMTAMHAKLLPGADGSPPRIILDPVYHLSSSAGEVYKLVQTLLAFVPIGVFARFVRPDTPVSHSMLVAGALAALTQGGSIFVQSARSDVIVLPLAMAAAALGWWLAGVRRSASEPCLPSVRHEAPAWCVLWMLTCFAICVVGWSPYIFELDPRQVLDKLRAVNWIPFRLHIGAPSFEEALDVAKQFGMFIPFGFFSARGYALPAASNLTRFVTVVVGALLLASFVEFSQVVVAGRYSDITDVVLAGGGATLGASLGLRAGDGA